jgi:hypothetical protein
LNVASPLVAMSLSHGVADGIRFWHIFNTWAKIHRRRVSGGEDCYGDELATPPPVFERCFFVDKCCPEVPITLPFGKVEDMVWRPVRSPVRECFFHFSADSVRNMKAKANAEMAGTTTATISLLQSLLAHLWRAVCHAMTLPPHRETTNLVLIGCRARMRGVPQGTGSSRVLQGYVGNAMTRGFASSTASEAEAKGLGWAAWLLNRAVATFDEASERRGLTSWAEEPSFLYVDGSPGVSKMVTARSPRFDVYGNDFGWGTPVTVPSGMENKVEGKATVFQGHGGGGSMALQVCLSHVALPRLIADQEFMDAVSTAE